MFNESRGEIFSYWVCVKLNVLKVFCMCTCARIVVLIFMFYCYSVECTQLYLGTYQSNIVDLCGSIASGGGGTSRKRTRVSGGGGGG